MKAQLIFDLPEEETEFKHACAGTVGGTAYLIVMHGWSAWWVIPAFLAIVWPPQDKKEK